MRLVRFPDESSSSAPHHPSIYRNSDSESPETKRILEQINRVNINLGYIKKRPAQPQLRFPNNAGSSISSTANTNHHHFHNNQPYYAPHDTFQQYYQGNNQNYVPSIRRSIDTMPRTSKIEQPRIVLVPDFVDLQTFIYPAHLLKSISLLDALKIFEPELMKSKQINTRKRTKPNSIIDDHRTKNSLNSVSSHRNESGSLNDETTDKINIILVTLKPKEEKKSIKRHRKARARRTEKLSSKQKHKRQTQQHQKVQPLNKAKAKTIFTSAGVRPRPNAAAFLKNPVTTTQPAVRQEATNPNKGPFAALFDRPNEVVEAIKQGGIIIQRLRVRNGGIAIAGPNGIATAGSGGTAIVGPGGTAITHPKGLSIAGPGARVISVPESADLKSLALSTGPGEVPVNGTVVAHGPAIYYHHPTVEKQK